MTAAENIIGKQFRQLTVLEISHYNKHGCAYVRCKCTCGNYTVVNYRSLLIGCTASCGCLKRSRAKNAIYQHYTALWNIWYGMKRRCYCENAPEYHNYGEKGISVCDEWRNDFMAFYDWSIKNGYEGTRNGNKDFVTIDRIDVNGNYEPSNCRWATPKQQALNKRNNCYVNLNGERVTIKEAADTLKIDYMRLYNALYRNGYDMQKALDAIKPQPSVGV